MPVKRPLTLSVNEVLPDSMRTLRKDPRLPSWVTSSLRRTRTLNGSTSPNQGRWTCEGIEGGAIAARLPARSDQLTALLQQNQLLKGRTLDILNGGTHLPHLPEIREKSPVPMHSFLNRSQRTRGNRQVHLVFVGPGSTDAGRLIVLFSAWQGVREHCLGALTMFVQEQAANHEVSGASDAHGASEPQKKLGCADQIPVPAPAHHSRFANLKAANLALPTGALSGDLFA